MLDVLLVSMVSKIDDYFLVCGLNTRDGCGSIIFLKCQYIGFDNLNYYVLLNMYC
jgi:hypothetical protein